MRRLLLAKAGIAAGLLAALLVRADAGLVQMPISTGGPAPPSGGAAPVLSGTGAVGNTLTCTTGGGWTGAGTITYKQQFFSNTTSVAGPTTSPPPTTYVVASGDAGKTITCKEIATNTPPGGSTTSAASNGIAIPAAAIAFVKQAAPTGSGSGTGPFTYSYTTTAGNANTMLVVTSEVDPQVNSDGAYTAVYNGITCNSAGLRGNNPNGLASAVLALCPIGTSDGVAHNLVITLGFTAVDIQTSVAEYSGVAQTSYLDGATACTGAAGAGACTSGTSLTTAGNGSWLVGMAMGQTTAPSATGVLSNVGAAFPSGGTYINQYADSHGTVPVGVNNFNFTANTTYPVVAIVVGMKHG